MTAADTCKDHSGCLSDIEHLKTDNKGQWSEIISMRNKVDSIMTRLNVILGCIVVAVIMLLINLTFKIV